MEELKLFGKLNFGRLYAKWSLGNYYLFFSFENQR